jgi:hypothetical protein
VVMPYEYNGTKAPVYTTFFGLYDHFFSYGRDSDWNLPDRWATPHPELNLNTPLNFISTADTYGGNSGSPAVNPELEIVGLNFDRNIEGLSRDFILLPERGRNIMVDVRAIREALDKVYDADRIVQEVLTHRLLGPKPRPMLSREGGMTTEQTEGSAEEAFPWVNDEGPDPTIRAFVIPLLSPISPKGPRQSAIRPHGPPPGDPPRAWPA